MSTHECPVVEVKLEPHPNADSLSLVRVFGWTCVVKTDDWRGLERGVYIPPDYVVPEHDRFAFLGDHRRIKVRKFRGVISQGLLMPLEADHPVGHNMLDEWGIVRYEPPPPKQGTPESMHTVGAPNLYTSKYDIESYERWRHLFQPGEEVVITEKIHGANARFVWHNGQMYVGSRTNWYAEHPQNPFWKAFYSEPNLLALCQRFKDHIFYGEAYGSVQDLRYGAEPGEVRLVLFDVRKDAKWIVGNFIGDQRQLHWMGVSSVPVVYRGPLPSSEELRRFADGDSQLCPDQMGEGIVIRPIVERETEEIGRLILKMVSNRYLEKA